MKNKFKNKYFRRNSLQFIIAVYCIIVSLFPMIYMGFSLYGKFSNTFIKSSRVTVEQIMEQLKINVEQYLEQGIKTTGDIDTIIAQYNRILDSKLLSDLNMYYSTRNDIVSISLFDLNGKLLESVPGHNLKESYNIKKEKWYGKICRQRVTYYISKPHVQNVFKNQHEWVISICKPIDIQNRYIDKKAVLVVDISIKNLNNLFSNLNLGGRGYVYIADNNKILYHPQQAVVFSKLKEEKIINTGKDKSGEININAEGDEFLLVYKALSFVDWNIIGVSYIDIIASENIKIAKEVAFTIPIILMIIILISWYISGKISMPIMKLQRNMQRVQEGDFDVQVNIENGEKEVLQLADSFNIMVKKIKELIQENQLEQEAKRQSELNALQAQINPHFLYNTLDSIMWMAEGGQNDEVVEMVTALARFFRISISRGKDIITVEEELEHAKNYLLIQKVRFKDKFQFTITASEEVKKLKTIKLLLQPLIENSLYHGIEYMVDEGNIDIRAFLEGEFLILEVEDDGLGMCDEQIEKILKSNENNYIKGKGSGVGIKNVEERIKLKFGSGYGIRILSEIEEGTTISLILPINRGEKNEG